MVAAAKRKEKEKKNKNKMLAIARDIQIYGDIKQRFFKIKKKKKRVGIYSF